MSPAGKTWFVLSSAILIFMLGLVGGFFTFEGIEVCVNGRWNRHPDFADDTIVKAALFWMGVGLGLQTYRLISSLQRSAAEPPTAFRAGFFNMQIGVQVKLLLPLMIVPLLLCWLREGLRLF